MMKGRVHSIQTLGTLDGPGVRFVVFVQGCCLRCACCHNPDTWDMTGGKEYSPEEIVVRAKRYKEYFGEKGGITFSGGEPLLQADFVRKTFELCHDAGINTCLDTAGCLLNDGVLSLLDVTDRVLLDVKYTDAEKYRKYVGCEFSDVLGFLGMLEKKKIPTTLRQVIIPTLNDSRENMLRLKEIVEKYSVIDGVELLPFRKICVTKYESMGIEFPLADVPTPTDDDMSLLYDFLK